MRPFAPSILALAAVLLALAGCPAEPVPPDSASGAADSRGATAERASPPADPREAQIMAPAEYRALPRFAAADPERGEQLFLQCTVCHTLGRGEAHTDAGPNLWGMFGRPAAVHDDYGYSAALRSADLVWTPAALERWLHRPAAVVPGTEMAYAGMREAQDLTDLIAFLLRETSEPVGNSAHSR